MIARFARLFELEGRQLLARIAPHDERDGIMLVWSVWADDAGSIELKLAGGDLDELTPHEVIERLTDESALAALHQIAPFLPCFSEAARG